jgi:hypothetical protein
VAVVVVVVVVVVVSVAIYSWFSLLCSCEPNVVLGEMFKVPGIMIHSSCLEELDMNHITRPFSAPSQ